MRTFAVVGQDARVQAAGGMLRRMGFEVLEAEQLYRADYILLPMPLEGDRAGLAQLLRDSKLKRMNSHLFQNRERKK